MDLFLSYLPRSIRTISQPRKPSFIRLLTLTVSAIASETANGSCTIEVMRHSRLMCLSSSDGDGAEGIEAYSL